MSKTPRELTTRNWKEVRENHAVCESWGLTPADTVDDFRETVYAVKFNVTPQVMPNYRGEVILLMGDGLEPLVLVRGRGGKLVAAGSRRGSRQPATKEKKVFVTVMDGAAEVDHDTVPEGIDVEVIDIDDLRSDARAYKRLSPEARAYAEDHGYYNPD